MIEAKDVGLSDVPQNVRVGVGVLIMRGNKILMGKRKGSHGAGTYSIPGGHLEFGETIATCAKRETFEETGIVIHDPVMQAGFTNDIFKEEGKHYATLWVLSRFNEGEPQTMEPEKCEGWDWYDIEHMPEPLFVPMINWVKNLHKHLSESHRLNA